MRKVVHQRYERGRPVSDLETVGKTKLTGTKVTFKPDSKIFEVTEFDDSILTGRLRDLAFLNAGVRIVQEGREWFAKPGHQGFHHAVEFEGLLTVTDPAEFAD